MLLSRTFAFVFLHQVDIFIRLLKKADDYVREDLLDLFAVLIASTSSVQGYAAERLFNEVLRMKADAQVVESTFKLDRFAFNIFGEAKGSLACRTCLVSNRGELLRSFF